MLREACEHQPESVSKLLLEIGARFSQCARRECAGGFDIDGIIHDHERLEWRAGARTPQDAGLTARRVERLEAWVMRGAFPEDVQTAAVQVRAFALLIF